MSTFFQDFRAFVARLSAGQRVATGAVLLGGILLLVAIARWAGQPDYALLFGRLEPASADQVVEALREQGTPYQLQEGGSAIYVPRADVYELRLHFAGQGVVSNGPAGYELFDQGTLGMTDFMQKLNFKRALEGELARTIASIRQVETSRVHLVMPERSPFRKVQAEPSASVVVQQASAARLTEAQIEGIGVLVAGAVEGLAPSDVTVLDTRGNLLSRPDVGDSGVAASSAQLRARRAVEAYLAEKGQSMLDQVLGPGNAVVRVSATLDFDRAATERELIDPESATVISEERLDEKGRAQNANSSVRSFEVSRTKERLEKSVGDVASLTLSVILNQKMAPTSEAVPEPPPIFYSEREIENVEALVKNAVGFDLARGDRFAIYQTRFDTGADGEIATGIESPLWEEQLHLYLRYGLMVLALVVIAWLGAAVLRHLTRRTSGGRLAGADGLSAARLAEGRRGRALRGRPQALRGEDVYASKLSPEARAHLAEKHLAFEDARQRVLENPERVAGLVRAWLNEDAAPPSL